MRHSAHVMVSIFVFSEPAAVICPVVSIEGITHLHVAEALRGWADKDISVDFRAALGKQSVRHMFLLCVGAFPNLVAMRVVLNPPNGAPPPDAPFTSFPHLCRL